MRIRSRSLRAFLKITRGAAARDFGWGQGGLGRASPKWAVRSKPTLAPGKRAAARRVFAEMVPWLRCSSVKDPPGIWASQALQRCFPQSGFALARRAVSFVAPRHAAISAKTAPLGIFKQALRQLFRPKTATAFHHSLCRIGLCHFNPGKREKSASVVCRINPRSIANAARCASVVRLPAVPKRLNREDHV